MGLVLKHIVHTKAGTIHYRRRFPKAVADIIGQGEFKRRLGETEREALRNYPKVNAEFERLVRNARAQTILPTTPLEVHREAERLAREMAQGVVYLGDETLSASDPNAADIIRDSIFSSHRTDEETGEPVGVPDVEARAISLLVNGGQLARPAPTLEDARRLYVQERITGDISEAKKVARLNLVIKHMKAASVGSDRRLDSLTRDDARSVRDYMLRDLDMSPTTVQRYLNDVRAMVSIGITELGVRDAVNPFLNLPVRHDVAAVHQRDPISDKLLPLLRARISEHAGADLWAVWRIVEGTGCRLGEVTGLLVSDVSLDSDIPHFTLTHHPHRRLKNNGSARNVPLIGEALEAAKEAVEAAGKSPYLFPRYGRVRGADAASKILMKHIRTVTDERKIVVHSLRHRMEDCLTRAGVSEYDRNLVLGHSTGSMSERYGSVGAHLEVAARALEAALVD
ncbi:site-specific recombinase, phage integrase family protein [Nitratireductor indicus C115]|uniref:Site-specific recombinase, phage integrase family protein n=1 Tax=Nitratireductor indicus C115 TaxID=1231190 RepID=K2P5P0_9HYPH|nr:site-specific recombinase, phage integrase family protein [Nitratireductor indicus C115]SFQ37931.1 Site-specific recombinase XerD [Nitratireductor indicus]